MMTLVSLQQLAPARQAALACYQQTLDRSRSKAVQSLVADDMVFVDSGYACLERGGPAAPEDPNGFAVITERATIYIDTYEAFRIEHSNVDAIAMIEMRGPSAQVQLTAGGRTRQFATPHIFGADWTNEVKLYGRRMRLGPEPRDATQGHARILLAAEGRLNTRGRPRSRDGVGYLLSNGWFTFVQNNGEEWEIGTSTLRTFHFDAYRRRRLCLVFPIASPEAVSVSVAPAVGQIGAWVHHWVFNGLRETVG